MRTTRRIICTLLFLLLALCLPVTPPLSAQVGTATLSGTVTDPSGAVVDKAQVILDSSERKFTRAVSTDSTGNYMFTALPPGTYKLQASASGFRNEEIDAVSLSSGQASTLNVNLKVASASGQVTVTEAPPLLQTTNATIGSSVGAREVMEL